MREAAAKQDAGAPTRAQIMTALSWSRDEILLGRSAVRRQFHSIEDAIDGLVKAFEDGRYAEIAQAAGKLTDASLTLSNTTSQIRGLASTLANKSREHMNRRPRP